MSTIGNIFWILFGGLFIFFEYLFGGLLLCLTIIGIPFGLQCFKVGVLSLTPFGRKIIDKEGTSQTVSVILNIIWILIGGIWIAFSHLILGVVLCITLIGIPFGIQHFKLMKLAFMPFGKDFR